MSLDWGRWPWTRARGRACESCSTLLMENRWMARKLDLAEAKGRKRIPMMQPKAPGECMTCEQPADVDGIYCGRCVRSCACRNRLANGAHGTRIYERDAHLQAEQPPDIGDLAPEGGG